MAEFRSRPGAAGGANGNNGTLPMPTRQHSGGQPGTGANGRNNNNGSGHPFDMARSPPNANANSKNTKHVPCKFFRQGACQAGPACPFLHSTDNTIEMAPCKYFTKGNCKFGAKCALAHILPNGQRVNKPGMQMGMGGGHLNLGGRVPPSAYQNADSALANSLLQQPGMNGGGQRYGAPYQYPQDDWPNLSNGHGQYEGNPYGEHGVTSNPGSNYGSPTDDSLLPISPGGGHLTALDAQLPSSFESQGISHIARYGPVAASVPSRFGLASPRSTSGPTEALRNLHDTAFGADLRKQAPVGLGSSPSGFGDDGFNSRVLHSQRVSKPHLMSASVPRPGLNNLNDDWPEDNFAMEEDFVPGSLRDDVLTPQEKMRTLSRTEHDFSSSLSKDFSSFGISTTPSAAKTGSPSMSSSPSRFGALFAQRAQKSSDGHAASGIGPVGSPLRESSFPFSSSPGMRPIGSRPTSGDVSPHLASPPSRHASVSLISQQLTGTSLHPSSARQTSNPPPNRLDRSISSTSNVQTTRIDEEGENDLVFSMEEEENSKRNSVAWASGKSPSLGPLKEQR